MDSESRIKGGEVMNVIYLDESNQMDAGKVKNGEVVAIFGEPYIAAKKWSDDGRLFVRLRDGVTEWYHDDFTVVEMDAKVEVAFKRVEVE